MVLKKESPSKEDVYSSASLLNFDKPTLYTPAKRFIVAKIEIIDSHDKKIFTFPYSVGDIMRVKIGTVIKLIPFCKVEQTTAQNEAFTTGDMDLYLIKNFLIIFIADIKTLSYIPL